MNCSYKVGEEVYSLIDKLFLEVDAIYELKEGKGHYNRYYLCNNGKVYTDVALLNSTIVDGFYKSLEVCIKCNKTPEVNIWKSPSKVKCKVSCNRCNKETDFENMDNVLKCWNEINKG